MTKRQAPAADVPAAETLGHALTCITEGVLIVLIVVLIEQQE